MLYLKNTGHPSITEVFMIHLVQSFPDLSISEGFCSNKTAYSFRWRSVLVSFLGNFFLNYFLVTSFWPAQKTWVIYSFPKTVWELGRKVLLSLVPSDKIHLEHVGILTATSHL